MTTRLEEATNQLFGKIEQVSTRMTDQLVTTGQRVTEQLDDASSALTGRLDETTTRLFGHVDRENNVIFARLESTSNEVAQKLEQAGNNMFIRIDTTARNLGERFDVATELLERVTTDITGRMEVTSAGFGEVMDRVSSSLDEKDLRLAVAVRPDSRCGKLQHLLRARQGDIGLHGDARRQHARRHRPVPADDGNPRRQTRRCGRLVHRKARFHEQHLPRRAQRSDTQPARQQRNLGTPNGRSRREIRKARRRKQPLLRRSAGPGGDHARRAPGVRSACSSPASSRSPAPSFRSGSRT